MREPSRSEAEAMVALGGGASPSGGLARVLVPVDALFNRLFTTRYNPLYQTGAFASGLLLVMVATGLYLLWFYQTGSPYESIQELQNQPWAGRWIRALHRYSADAAVVAVVLHALRMFIQGKTWGPRALAWITGVLLLGILLMCGWTGLILVWDVQGKVIAEQGARLLDLLPLFSEPISRSFITPEGIGSAFFFLNLFAHIAMPLVIALFLWVHTMRVARPKLLPPRRLWWGTVIVFTAFAVVYPVPLPPKADLLALPAEYRLDWFYGFWVPLSQNVPPLVHGLGWLLLGALAFSVPWWWRPGREVMASKSYVDPLRCTGCGQCYIDCPYEAIAMVPRTEGQGSDLVARVAPGLCVGCAICSGSCAPMESGPGGRKGRDHLREMTRFFEWQHPGASEVVLLGCAQSAAAHPTVREQPGVRFIELGCAGALHTSSIEYLIRRGVGGVYVLGCPPRDCQFREGPQWLHGRLYEDREAELQPRVDRRRVRMGLFARPEVAAAAAAVAAFVHEMQDLAEHAEDEGPVEIDTECEEIDAADL